MHCQPSPPITRLVNSALSRTQPKKTMSAQPFFNARIAEHGPDQRAADQIARFGGDRNDR
jgi:hypothetical protein